MSLDAYVLGGLAAAGAIPVIRERLRTPITKNTRRAATGHFSKLSHGDTHYALLGPPRGPVAVCVHGLSTPSFVWRGLARQLAAMGFQVLIYDLYGRGYSDRPKDPQTPAFFVKQLEELLAKLEIRSDITLFGYSMGGVIAAAFAAHHPEMLRRLVLVAPAGMTQNLGKTAKFATEWPLVGDWAFHMGYPRHLKRGIEADRATPKSIEGFEDMQLAELGRRGYLRSILSSLRHTLRTPIPGIHAKLVGSGIPVCAIWGRDDTVIPITGLGTLTQWNRAVQHEVIDGAGHGLLYTHTDAVADAVRRLTGLAPE